ncbi:hypothetical protein JOC70_002736 [Clostridium pascui]|uniref:4-fold beta flower protein n=1 Tax=Clostridium pascui TaxID=46609 RepID=UPI00195D7532|nr:hypothetical protein [Clostridium pascui]MBM7871238.1 hypothetical protein [Clostridium pascui]
MEPYEPLYDRYRNLVAWVVNNQYIFDVNLRWVAYIANGYVWNVNEQWIGAINNLTLFDRQGRVVAWNPRFPISSLGGGSFYKEEPLFQPRPLRPEKPLIADEPLRPGRPPRPPSGWSPLTFDKWLRG